MRYASGLVLMTLALLLLMPEPLKADELADSGAEQGSSTVKESARSLHTASQKPRRLINTALADAATILARENSCSSFFGGAGKAVSVLERLISRVGLGELPNRHVGISMSGDESIFISHRTGYQYRLFKRVIINTNGPFYRTGNALVPIPRCGSFPPNTREVRVLMLLHELGHLIKGEDGQWLLPDDGRSDQLSLDNTRTIETKCLAQIRSLQSGDSLAQQSAGENDPARKR